MASYHAPREWEDQVQWLAGVLHGRSAWRFALLLWGALFASGRRVIATWIRTAGVSHDFQQPVEKHIDGNVRAIRDIRFIEKSGPDISVWPGFCVFSTGFQDFYFFLQSIGRKWKELGIRLLVLLLLFDLDELIFEAPTVGCDIVGGIFNGSLVPVGIECIGGDAVDLFGSDQPVGCVVCPGQDFAGWPLELMDLIEGIIGSSECSCTGRNGERIPDGIIDPGRPRTVRILSLDFLTNRIVDVCGPITPGIDSQCLLTIRVVSHCRPLQEGVAASQTFCRNAGSSGNSMTNALVSNSPSLTAPYGLEERLSWPAGICVSICLDGIERIRATASVANKLRSRLAGDSLDGLGHSCLPCVGLPPGHER